MNAVCLECPACFPVPAIARCPECGSRQIRPDTPEHIMADLYLALREVLDDDYVRAVHRDGLVDFAPWFGALRRAEGFLSYQRLHGGAG